MRYRYPRYGIARAAVFQAGCLSYGSTKIVNTLKTLKNGTTATTELLYIDFFAMSRILSKTVGLIPDSVGRSHGSYAIISREPSLSSNRQMTPSKVVHPGHCAKFVMVQRECRAISRLGVR